MSIQSKINSETTDLVIKLGRSLLTNLGMISGQTLFILYQIITIFLSFLKENMSKVEFVKFVFHFIK